MTPIVDALRILIKAQKDAWDSRLDKLLRHRESSHVQHESEEIQAFRKVESSIIEAAPSRVKESFSSISNFVGNLEHNKLAPEVNML